MQVAITLMSRCLSRGSDVDTFSSSFSSSMVEFDLIGPQAGEIFYAFGVLSATMLLGLALFFFFFGLLPYW